MPNQSFQSQDRRSPEQVKLARLAELDSEIRLLTKKRDEQDKDFQRFHQTVSDSTKEYNKELEGIKNQREIALEEIKKLNLKLLGLRESEKEAKEGYETLKGEESRELEKLKRVVFSDLEKKKAKLLKEIEKLKDEENTLIEISDYFTEFSAIIESEASSNATERAGLTKRAMDVAKKEENASERLKTAQDRLSEADGRLKEIDLKYERIDKITKFFEKEADIEQKRLKEQSKAIFFHEKQVKVKEEALKRKEKALKEKEIQLEDKEQTLKRVARELEQK